MLEIPLIDIENIIVRTEYYGNLPYPSYFTLSYKLEPAVVKRLPPENKRGVFKIIRNHYFKFSANLQNVKKLSAQFLDIIKTDCKKFEMKNIISNFTGRKRRKVNRAFLSDESEYKN